MDSGIRCSSMSVRVAFEHGLDHLLGGEAVLRLVLDALGDREGHPPDGGLVAVDEGVEELLQGLSGAHGSLVFSKIV